MSTYAFQVLRKVGLSDQLAYRSIHKLKIHSYDANQVIWRKGSEIESWQLIMSGLVSAAAPTTDGNSIPIIIYGHHAWFGEEPILNRKPSCLEYVCLTPTQVIAMPAATLWELFEAEPAFARFLAELMAWRAQKKTETLMLMKLGNPCLRVVMGLAQFAEALAYCWSQPSAECMDRSIEIPITQSMLSSLCGVSRTLVSEFVHELARNGWLSISYGRLELASLRTWLRFSNVRREQHMNNSTPTIGQLLQELQQASVVFS